MEKVLFVIDLQEIYAGRGRNKEKYRYDSERLIAETNQRIAEYKPEEIFYFKSIAKGIGGLLSAMPKDGTHEAKFAENLKVVSKNIYERSKPDVLALDQIVDFLRSRNIKQIELVGVDANNSISLTAVTATSELNIDVLFNNNCVSSPAPEKSVKIREKVKKSRITYID